MSLTLDREQRAASDASARTGELIDARAIAAELDELSASNMGGDGELRSVIAQRLKTALNRTFPDLANLQRWFAAIANRPGVQLGTSLKGRP